MIRSEHLLHRYLPNHLYLAIHELDEAHVGKFSFKDKESVLEVLTLTLVLTPSRLTACLFDDWFTLFFTSASRADIFATQIREH